MVARIQGALAIDRSMHHQPHQGHQNPLVLHAQGHLLVSMVPESPPTPMVIADFHRLW
jgi:hypothetical protein